VKCSHCGKHLAHDDKRLICTEAWCSDACLSAWEDADPARKEGWVSLSDITPERQRELFAASGLMLGDVRSKVTLQ